MEPEGRGAERGDFCPGLFESSQCGTGAEEPERSASAFCLIIVPEATSAYQYIGNMQRLLTLHLEKFPSAQEHIGCTEVPTG